MSKALRLAIGVACLLAITLWLSVSHEPTAVVGEEVVDVPANFPSQTSPTEPNFDPRVPVVRRLPEGEPEFDADHLMVKFRSGSNAAVIEQVAARIGADVVTTYRASGLVRISLPDNVSHSQALTFFQGQPEVQVVEPDLLYYTTDIPDDPDFGTLWGLHNVGQDGGVEDKDIEAPHAWIEISDSRDFVIGVIDSGVQLDHPDLTANLWVNPNEIPNNQIDDDGNGFVDDVHGIDQIEFDGSPDDDYGHGTHVGGTIAAVGNNGIGVSGVLWDAEVLHCKVFSIYGWTTLSRILTCVDYLIWAKSIGENVVVLNASWGGGGYSQLLSDAIIELRDNQILVVASAGNDGRNIDDIPMYPAAYDYENIIAVAAHDRTGALAGFSNYGALSVDIAAPGVDVNSTTKFSDYGYANGTSMAAPHVTGVVAMTFAADPSMSMSEVRDHVLATGVQEPAYQGLMSSESRLRISLPFIDLDNDQISDRWEVRFGLDPANPADASLDFDTDGLDNLAEYQNDTDPNDSDSDGDGLTDGEEVLTYFSDPLLIDTDGDGLTDGEEVQTYGTSPIAEDTDADGLTDAEEISTTGTDPLDADTDGDDLLDGFEIEHGFDPFSPVERDTDDDADGLSAYQEQGLGTDPNVADTDSDALSDGDEALVHSTDPLNRDTDGDDMFDGFEVQFAFDPFDPSDASSDSDTDGYSNREEFRNTSDPRDRLSVPPFQPWGMMQADARRSGFIRISTDASNFSLRAYRMPLPYGIGPYSPIDRYSFYGEIVGEEDKGLRSVDAATQRENWRHVPVVGPSPILNDGMLLSLNTNDSTGEPELVAVDADTGALVASPVTLATRAHTLMLAADGQVLLRESDPASVPDAMVLIDAGTGQVIWRTVLNGAIPWGNAYPAMDANYVAVLASDKLHVLNRSDGTYLQEVDIPNCSYLNSEGVAIDEHDHAIVWCDSRMTRIDLSTGSIGWHQFIQSGEPAIDRDHMLLADWDRLIAIELESGAEVWSWTSLGGGALLTENVISTLDHVFVSNVESTFAINKNNGQLEWTHGQGGRLAVTGDGVLLIVGSQNGTLEVVDLSGDYDGDGMSDWWERHYGFDFADASDAGGDADQDGLSNLQEYNLDTIPTASDTDSDGLSDSDEVNLLGTDPHQIDTDGDGLSDFDEINSHSTDPLSTDTDGDGFDDGDEINSYGTDPSDSASTPALLTNYFESFESGMPVDWINGTSADGGFAVVAGDATDGVQSIASDFLARGDQAAIEWTANFDGGDLAFDSKIVSGTVADRLRVYVDGAMQVELNSVDWITSLVAVPRGTHTVRFEFRNSSDTVSNRALIDNVSYGKPVPFGSNMDNVLLVHDGRLHEYDRDGNIVRAPLEIEGGADPRDLAVTHDHKIMIWDAPNVILFDPLTESFDSIVVPRIGNGSNLHTSPITAHEQSVFLGLPHLYELDLSGQLQASNRLESAFVDLQSGKDGHLYGMAGTYGQVEKVDAQTGAAINVLQLPSHESRGIAVNAQGDIYAIRWSEYVERHDSQGVLLDSVEIFTKNAFSDLDLNDRGMLAIGGAKSEFILLHDDFSEQKVVQVPGSVDDSVFVAAVPRGGKDSDGDSLPDWWEVRNGLDETDALDAALDSDVDGVTNLQEYQWNGNPNNSDTDSDGLTDSEEIATIGSDPTLRDSDRDGLEDWNEVNVVGTSAILDDTDGDGLTDGEEVNRIQSNPLSNDSDGDGLDDRYEYVNRLNPSDASDAAVDNDLDGLTNVQELAAGTSVIDFDTDGDGLADGEEVLSTATDPLNPDSDSDRMNDGWEVRFGLDPNNSLDADVDDDSDSFTNAVEYFAKSNPVDASSVPVPSQWTTDQGSITHTGYVPYRLNFDDFAHEWTINPVQGSAAPTRQVSVSRDSVLVTTWPQASSRDDWYLSAMDRVDGALLWQHLMTVDGELSGPTHDGATVFAHTTSNEDAFLYGLEIITGTTVFQEPTAHERSWTKPPTVARGGVFVPMRDRGIGRFDSLTGAPDWYNEKDRTHGFSPTVDSRNVYAYSAEENRFRTFDIDTGYESSFDDELNVFGGYVPHSSPIPGSHGNFIVSINPTITSFLYEDRKAEWSVPTTYQYLPIAVANGVIYYIDQWTLIAISEFDGAELWRWSTNRLLEYSLVATVDHVFVTTDVETYAINVQTHVPEWAYPTGGIASLSDDGVLYISETDGDVTAIRTQIDTDDDRIPDTWEIRFSHDPNDALDASTDIDGDGLTHLGEFLARTNPLESDTDGDGLSDGAEIDTHSSNPLLVDTDGDGLSDSDEVQVYGTSAEIVDSDEDGLPDAWETNTTGTNPNSSDGDGDGFTDANEILAGSDPASSGSQPEFILSFFESFERGNIPPEFDNGANGRGEWRVDKRRTTDGKFLIRPERVTTSGVAEIEWTAHFEDGVLSFFARMEEFLCCDRLEMLVDDQLVVTIDSAQDWTPHFVNLSRGRHKITWRFTQERVTGTEKLETFIDAIAFNTADEDGDGMPYDWEIANGLDPTDPSDSSEDPDTDGLPNLQEYRSSTDPWNPDTDADGMPDGWEFDHGIDPAIHNANDDADNDNLSNIAEYHLGTHPTRSDTDNDRMPDGWEDSNSLDPLTNDANQDPDGDGATNLQEYQAGTDPNNANSTPPLPPPPPGGGGGKSGGGGGAMSPLEVVFGLVLFLFALGRSREGAWQQIRRQY